MHGRFIHYFGCPLIARARPQLGLSTVGAKRPYGRIEAGARPTRKAWQTFVVVLRHSAVFGVHVCRISLTMFDGTFRQKLKLLMQVRQ